MRRFHWILMAAWLPGAAFAQAALAQDQQSVIRIEAKRGQTATAQSVAGWQAKFDDVVTFPLAGGWTAIALGPLSSEEAAARLEQLKAEGEIPADSFVAQPGRAVIQQIAPAPDAEATAPVDGSALPVTEIAPETAPEVAPEVANDDPAANAGPAVVPSMGMNLDPLGAPPPGVIAPDRHIRIEAFQERAEADAALTKWREIHPDAALWQLPNDWFAIGLGPLDEAEATAWLAAFKLAEAAPKDAFVATTAEMGAPIVAGSTPDLPAPPATAAEMPPLDEVQRALRWAGHYDGDIDGRSGPMTRAAINAEILSERASPDAGTAMAALIQRRIDWRDDMGLTQLQDAHTGLAGIVPMDRLEFDRNERALSIYGPKDGSGVALILFSQPGGQQELLDLSGLVIALGWVPKPKRDVKPGSITLDGRNDTHIGHAEGRVRDGRAEGFVLIWPLADEANQRPISAELSDSFTRTAPAANDPQAAPEASTPAIGTPTPATAPEDGASTPASN